MSKAKVSAESNPPPELHVRAVNRARRAFLQPSLPPTPPESASPARVEHPAGGARADDGLRRLGPFGQLCRQHAARDGRPAQARVAVGRADGDARLRDGMRR
eukprot:6105492-Prymnesium_polylepis.1